MPEWRNQANAEDLKSSGRNDLVGSNPTSGTRLNELFAGYKMTNNKIYFKLLKILKDIKLRGLKYGADE